tara:strand:- start:196 stop:453 length:258 start_codon:yes stop_codon:yes gene_type:complete
MEETKDKNGNIVRIGDRVNFSHESKRVDYEFTVEEIKGEWIWGSDLPEGERYCYGDEMNYHNNNYVELVSPKNTYCGSVLKFNFV